MQIPVKEKFSETLSTQTINEEKNLSRVHEYLRLFEMDGYYLLLTGMCKGSFLNSLQAFSDRDSAKDYLESIGVEIDEPGRTKDGFADMSDYDQ
jgi:hypothetical protein